MNVVTLKRFDNNEISFNNEKISELYTMLAGYYHHDQNTIFPFNQLGAVTPYNEQNTLINNAY